MIEDIARRYVEGESLNDLAREYGMRESTLRDRLDQSGSVWVQRFRAPNLDIDEEIETRIPPLLDEATIRAIRKQADDNRTFKHGQLKYKYLIS